MQLVQQVIGYLLYKNLIFPASQDFQLYNSGGKLCMELFRSRGRGFIGWKDPENVDDVIVDQTAVDTLTSPLTTVFMPVLYIIVLVVGLPANAMAVWVFLFRTKKKHPSSIYMANLALADLLFVIWTPLKISYHFQGNNWTYGEPLCKVLMGFFYGNMYCSGALHRLSERSEVLGRGPPPVPAEEEQQSGGVRLRRHLGVHLEHHHASVPVQPHRQAQNPQHHHLPRRQRHSRPPQPVPFDRAAVLLLHLHGFGRVPGPVRRHRGGLHPVAEGPGGQHGRQRGLQEPPPMP
ncbi:hypothetical protein fugu_019175 [Takifugu bimaculatus]|uniref:G-protein coupled receptors family 1 profile domain-containing protein n=1 Tax=Takifugu bimaculatus TaxID=433685 RepID=A0A4Z2BIL8_9TELE|nr:hypothetical protein fugu_019175 [Takifugu bimaculatus]